MLSPAIEGIIRVKYENLNKNDKMKAGHMLQGKRTTYDQGYQALKDAKSLNKICDLESFQQVMPYLNKFVEKNHELVVDHT